ncbi:MAG: alpha/beta hydrolase [Acidobacteriota bacterium]
MATPLVFLHGWCGTPALWSPISSAFAAERDVRVPQLAYDGSLPPLPERCIVIGHSMGATLARRLLRHRPDLIAAAVFVDGHLPKYPPDPARREPFLQPFREDYAHAARAYIDTMIGPDTPPGVKESMLAQPASLGLSALESLSDSDVCAWLGTDEDCVRVPVFALWASPTPMARVGVEHEAWMRRWCSQLRYDCWPGTSHFLHIEQPVRFTAALRQFLETSGL